MNARDLGSQSVLLSSHQAGVTMLTLNRPDQFNSLSEPLLDLLQAELDRIANDKSVRVVILAAAGRGFCSGHDLKEIRSIGDQSAVEKLFAKCSRMMMRIGSLPQPVIAKVHGLATAAGCQLVAACDLAIASSHAQFSTPGVNMGAFCSTPSVALGRNVARKHAMQMLLTAEVISADRAAEIGLVNRVVLPEQLDFETVKLARLLTTKSAAAIATGKRIFYEQLSMPLDQAYAFAGHAIACDFAGADAKEGIDAFLGKRHPDFPSNQA